MDDPAASPFSIDVLVSPRRRADPTEIAKLALLLKASTWVEVLAGGRHDRFPVQPDSDETLAVLGDPAVIRRLATAVTTVSGSRDAVDSGRGRQSDVCLTFTDDPTAGGPWLQVAGSWATYSQFEGGWPVDASAVAQILAVAGIPDRCLPRDPDQTRRPWAPLAEAGAMLTERWLERLPGSRPVWFELREALPERWVRLHSFPGGRRHVEDEADFRQVVRRHRAVLDDLSGGSEMLLITPSWSGDLDPVDRVSYLEAIAPDSQFWQSFAVEELYGGRLSCVHLWVETVSPDDSRLDLIFRMAATEAISGVIVADPELRWLFAPYDGGTDVIAGSEVHRDRLAARFHHWLPPDGPL